MTDTMEPVKEINLNDLKARLDKAVEVLGKVVPILRNEKVNPITTEDIVEAEALLCEVAVHVEWFDCDVCSGECPLEA